MAEQSKHTPPPWRIMPIAVSEPDPGEDGIIYEYHIREDMVKVFQTFDLELAERVVRAVNAHEELLAVVKESLECFKLDSKGPGSLRMIKMCKQAIAKAEEKC